MDILSWCCGVYTGVGRCSDVGSERQLVIQRHSWVPFSSSQWYHCVFSGKGKVMKWKCLPVKEEELSFVKVELQVVCRHPLRAVSQTHGDLTSVWDQGKDKISELVERAMWLGVKTEKEGTQNWTLRDPSGACGGLLRGPAAWRRRRDCSRRAEFLFDSKESSLSWVAYLETLPEGSRRLFWWRYAQSLIALLMTITAFWFCDCTQCFRKKWKRGITCYFKTVWKTAS